MTTPPSAEKTLRVVIADDHPVVREGIAAIVSRAPDLTVVAEAADGASAVEQVLRLSPDVTLMDLRMPEMSGLEALQAILRARPAARIVMLTTYDGEEDIFRALECGAMGYLLKDLTSAELLAAIRAAAAGKRVVTGSAAAGLANRIGRTALSGREEAVLRLVAAGKSNKEIAVALSISTETVKTYVKSLFHKLGVSDRTEAAMAALRRGFVHLDELLPSAVHLPRLS